MNIGGLYTQNFSYFRVTATLTAYAAPQDAPEARPATRAADASSSTPADTVTVSAAAVSLSVTGAPGAAGTTDAATDAVAGDGRADALFQALDGDQDGVITAEEFTDGARELLRRAGRHHPGHHRHGGVDGEDGARHDGRSDRLTAKLERLFKAIDANGDGSVDQAELGAALDQLDARRAARLDRALGRTGGAAASTSETSASPSGKTAASAPAPAGADEPVTETGDAKGAGAATPTASPTLTTTSIYTVTVVSIAIQRYTTISLGAPQTSAPTGPSDAPTAEAKPSVSVAA
jgi:EF hand/EF-hand domain